MLEEHENQETSLQDLIDLVERDDLPTNEFTIQDKDPMVILGKLNEVIAYLQTLQATINASDSKANEALQKAIQAVADATQALSVANGIDAKATQALANAIEAVGTANTALSASNTALSTANTAISTANTALSSANSAVEKAENALDTAEGAETKADTAITTANGAKTTAEGIDAKATTALANSQTAVSTANTAETKAQEALDQVVDGLGTKVYRDSQLLSTLDIKPIEDDIAENTTAITALQNGKVDKVTGKQLSTEDFTTAEKNKLAGLNNYDDTQVQADITALQTRATNIETKNTEQDTAIANAQSTANTANTNAQNAQSTADTALTTANGVLTKLNFTNALPLSSASVAYIKLSGFGDFLYGDSYTLLLETRGSETVVVKLSSDDSTWYVFADRIFNSYSKIQGLYYSLSEKALYVKVSKYCTFVNATVISNTNSIGTCNSEVSYSDTFVPSDAVEIFIGEPIYHYTQTVSGVTWHISEYSSLSNTHKLVEMWANYSRQGSNGEVTINLPMDMENDYYNIQGTITDGGSPYKNWERVNSWGVTRHSTYFTLGVFDDYTGRAKSWCFMIKGAVSK